MIKAIVTFHIGLWRLAWPWRLWLGFLLAVNMIAPLAFWHLIEARWTFAASMAAAMIMMVLTGLTGFSRLLGLGHLLTWGPLMVYLIPRVGAFTVETPEGLWIRIAVGATLISLVVDAVDVARWIRGERGHMVPMEG